MSRTVLRVSAAMDDLGYDGEWSDVEGMHFTGEPGMKPEVGKLFQVWQDVGEPTPISPTFATREDCAEWVARTHECSPVAALKFVDDAWAPSFIGTSFGLYSGVQMAAGMEEHLAFIAPEGSHPRGTRVRHLASGIDGTIEFRMPPPNGEYYMVKWERGLPTLLEAGDDPNKPMTSGCRAEDGFELLSDGAS